MFGNASYVMRNCGGEKHRSPEIHMCKARRRERNHVLQLCSVGMSTGYKKVGSENVPFQKCARSWEWKAPYVVLKSFDFFFSLWKKWLAVTLRNDVINSHLGKFLWQMGKVIDIEPVQRFNAVSHIWSNGYLE